MKRSTALKNANKIAGILKKNGGIICTPEALFEAAIIRRAWVFGSTAKGKENPNDLDILIDVKIVGRFNCNAKTNRDYTRRYGILGKLCTHETALRFLRKGTKMTRFHSLDTDGNLFDIPQTKIMIYPRNDLVA